MKYLVTYLFSVVRSHITNRAKLEYPKSKQTSFKFSVPALSFHNCMECADQLVCFSTWLTLSQLLFVRELDGSGRPGISLAVRWSHISDTV